MPLGMPRLVTAIPERRIFSAVGPSGNMETTEEAKRFRSMRSTSLASMLSAPPVPVPVMR